VIITKCSLCINLFLKRAGGGAGGAVAVQDGEECQLLDLLIIDLGLCGLPLEDLSTHSNTGLPQLMIVSLESLLPSEGVV
jgi:hypothetical protein